MTLVRWTTSLVLAGVCAAACSSKPQGTGIGNDDYSNVGKDAGAGGTGGGIFDETGGTTGAGTGGVVVDPSKQCGGTAFKAEPMPVDMYIMFDQSTSMGDPLPDNSGTWWAAASGAVTSFVNNPQAANMGVGIQYFPLGGVAPQSCAGPYSTPEVEVEVLSTNAANVAASIAKHGPNGFTPTAPALKGALDHMKAFAPGRPGRAPVVVFVTDGFPTECDPQQITDIAQIAKEAYEGTPSIRTFVVGFNLGAGGENLKEIARAGGTDKPFLINGGDIGSQFIEAMLGIASTPLQCEFDVPKPEDSTKKVDPAMVAVRYTPNATQVTEDIPRLNNLGDCTLNNNNGWYFNIPTDPTKILICPGTCAKFAAGSIQTVVGCKPPVGTTR